MDVSLSRVEKDEKDKLAGMLSEYESELTGEKKVPEYKYLDSYFDESNRWAFFIKYRAKTVGFVLINEHTLTEKNSKSISEFYIEPNFRKIGIGKEAALLAFKKFPGKWEIREMAVNVSGQIFWRNVISEADEKYTEVVWDNDKWRGPIQLFKID